MIATVISGLVLMKKRAMMEVFSPPIRKFLKEWELRAMALFSLLLQIILIISGKRRRQNPDRWIRAVVWSCYLMADSVATIALGILSKDLGDIYDDGGKLGSNDELTALWAPFFLLHLGGPDTITAYSLEDNELYLRHLFGLIVQTIVTGYIFLMAWTGSNLSVLGIPMIIVGSIKYGERTWALWNASSDELQDSMLSSPDHGPNYAKLMDEYSLRHAEGFLVDIEEVREQKDGTDRTITAPTRSSEHQEESATTTPPSLPPEEKIIKAYTMFEIFKRLFADLILSYQEQEKSQSLFRKLSPQDAFDVIEIELGFVFDMLYTKATVIYTGSGIFRRILTFYLTCCVLAIFYLDDLGKYKTVDIVITFLLLGGAIFLEIYAAITLVSSDQTKRWSIQKKDKLYKICWFLKYTGISAVIKFLKLAKVSWFLKYTGISAVIGCLGQHKMPRWSARMGQYSLISLFLNEKLRLRVWKKRLLGLLKNKWLRPLGMDWFGRLLEKNWFRLFERHGYKSHVPIEFDTGLGKQVFLHVKSNYTKSEGKEEDNSYLRDLCSQRGKKILEATDLKIEWSVNCEFDESILLWHIATELCCYTEEIENDFKPDLEMSQQISRYMLYLLAVYPYMLPAGIGLIRLRDTRAEAENFFEERLSTSDAATADKACKTLLDVEAHVQPIKVKGDRSKSVLFDACRLASKLKTIEDKAVKWRMIRDIWLEMLMFAANQCRGKEHAQHLRRGGELLTHVWLLMAHFGIIEQFQIAKGHSRAFLNKK